jgi:hypothetical protein
MICYIKEFTLKSINSKNLPRKHGNHEFYKFYITLNLINI